MKRFILLLPTIDGPSVLIFLVFDIKLSFRISESHQSLSSHARLTFSFISLLVRLRAETMNNITLGQVPKLIYNTITVYTHPHLGRSNKQTDGRPRGDASLTNRRAKPRRNQTPHRKQTVPLISVSKSVWKISSFAVLNAPIIQR